MIFAMIILWMLLSVGRLGNNYRRIFTSERKWLSMTDDQKRIELLGDEHVFLTEIRKSTKPNSSVLLVIPSETFFPGIFYKSLYYLYPRNIAIETQVEIGSLTDKSYDYVVVFNNLEENKKIKIAQYSYLEDLLFRDKRMSTYSKNE